MNEKQPVLAKPDFSSEFSEQLAIVEDLISVAIDEMGNGGTRTMSIILSVIRYISDMKSINHRLFEFERIQKSQ